MLLLAISLAFALVWVTIMHAQETTGTVTGRVYYRDFPDRPAGGQAMILVPAALRESLSFNEALATYSVNYDSRTGTFTVSALAAGEYLLGLYQNPDVLPTFDQMILLTEGPVGRTALPATRVIVAAGETTFVDIPVVIPPEWLTPEPTPTCPPSATASISGTVTYTGYHSGPIPIGWIPADTKQPAYAVLYSDNYAQADANGDFLIRCLEPSEYLVFVQARGSLTVDAGLEEVRFFSGNDRFSFWARRVRVADGGAATGVNFTVRFPTPQLIVDYFPTPTPTPSERWPYDDVSLPPAGAGADELLRYRQVLHLTLLLCGLVGAAGLAAFALTYRHR